MRPSLRRSLVPALVLAAAALALPGRAQETKPITIDDLLAMHRVGDPDISPDGTQVAYTVTTPDLAANRNRRDVWVVPAAGGAARQLTRTGRDGTARWSPDGSQLAFLSSRDGAPQVYLMPVAGGEPTKLTSLAGGVESLLWAPDGKALAVTSSVYPDCPDNACTAKRMAEREADPVKARVYDTLLYRHWTEWSTGRRSHLFLVTVATGAARDLTPGAAYDVPPPLREGPHPIAFSPDGREMAFVAVTDAVEAVSTNGDVFLVATDGSSSSPERLTSNPGFDGAPAYSPDGASIAYRSQARAGNEADRWRLMRFDRRSRAHVEVAPAFDRSVNALAWSPDSQAIYFNAEDRGHLPVFRVTAAGGEPTALTPGSHNGEFTLSRDGRLLVMTRSSQASPATLVATAADGGSPRQLTRHNADRLATLDLTPPEHFTFPGAGGTPVHAMLLRPPAFDPSKKYPVLMVLHGGPETQFGDAWSYRWNTQMFAAPGYAILMINRRGSTGFGQQFTDEINADWGGRPFEDLMKGLDAALAKYPFLDGNRVAAAGASYGGYMITWMASQAKGRFKALVAHAAVYDLDAMYGATEELWFPEWAFKGTPWTSASTYDKLSPHEKAAAFGQHKTPTLVIHGELDFRVPYTQGLEFYTALQRQGVTSRLVIFPDEGHWILKPQNAKFWYREVLGWIGRYL